MLAIFSCASAASGMLGKKVMKSLYSCSACASEAAPPSAYQESPTASLARAMNSESGYVLISVCKVMRATSKRLCLIASMALSKRTLSGCLDPMFASGLTDFLLVQAAVMSSNVPSTAMNEYRRDMNTSKCSCGDTRPFDFAQGRPRLSDRAKLGILPCSRIASLSAALDSLQRRFRGSFQQRLRILAWITATEHGVARNQNFRARLDHVGYGIQ